jgi:hypothetical protein
MTQENKDTRVGGRRAFLTQLSAAAVASVGFSGVARAEEPKPTTPAGTLAKVALGPYQLSRLIVGANPIHGYSYQGAHADQHMKEYFTVEQTVAFLRRCEHEGINTFQFSPGGVIPETLQILRDKGSKMNLICLHSDRAKLKADAETLRPIAFVHHGGASDRLFSQGKSQRVHDYVKAVHDAGLLAGVSAHNPDVIKRIADEGWNVDFFMTCFFFVTRSILPGAMDNVGPLKTLEFVYPFFKDDPMAMTEVIRQVKQPCLAFKILGAGRLCKNQESVKAAFQFAFERIKPTDAVIVGMYPRFFDEIHANAEYARQFAGRG